jgi:adenylosuccinate synthase
MLEERNINTSKLKISSNAHLIMPYHKILDELIELRLGNNKIGTTKRGIGPCYADKIQRQGIRVQDLLDEDIFVEKVSSILKEKNEILEKIYNHKPLNLEAIIEEFKPYENLVKKFMTDTSLLVSTAVRKGKKVLFEGAQGTLLDIDHGTYPFVTSSNTTAGNAAIGSGIGPLDINKIVGVTKAYISRVGTGPFITEQDNEIGEYLIKKGAEYGTVTGRKRRCGWLDLVSLSYAVRVNSLTELFITKLDVLSGLEELKLNIAYEVNGSNITDFPRQQRVLYDGKPVYETFEGWSEDISNITKYDKLPKQAKEYLEFVEEFIQVPITFISVGPERNQNILISK